MWFLRRIMRVPWTPKRTNQVVLEMAGTSRRFMKKIRKRQLRYVGLRGEILENNSLMGMIEGNRARGRQRIKYLDGIKTLVGVRNDGEVVRLAEDRQVR